MRLKALLTLSLLCSSAVWAVAANPSATKVEPDRRKGRIELPVKETLAKAAESNLTKKDVEVPLKEVLASETVPVDNPKVKPGSVSWHKDFDSACAAAKRSGKPVLLFQMMGNLDDRFC